MINVVYIHQPRRAKDSTQWNGKADFKQQEAEYLCDISAQNQQIFGLSEAM